MYQKKKKAVHALLAVIQMENSHTTSNIWRARRQSIFGEFLSRSHITNDWVWINS